MRGYLSSTSLDWDDYIEAAARSKLLQTAEINGESYEFRENEEGKRFVLVCYSHHDAVIYSGVWSFPAFCEGVRLWGSDGGN